MADTQTRRGASAGPPPAGSPASAGDEKKAGLWATVLGFVLGGPVGGIVMAMAVGIEQAFAKSGWSQPGWLGGRRPDRLTPEQVAERRAQAVADARWWAGQAHRAAQERRAQWAAHRQRMREYEAGGRQGDRPKRPKRRNPIEFFGDAARTSKSWYTLLDDRIARGGTKAKNAYGVLSRFGRKSWLFGTGLIEGARLGWNRHRGHDTDRASSADGSPICPVCGGPNNSFDSVCHGCRQREHRQGQVSAGDLPDEGSPLNFDPPPSSPGPDFDAGDPLGEEDDDDDEPFDVLTDEDRSRIRHEMFDECDCSGPCRFDGSAWSAADFAAMDESADGPLRAQAWVGEQPAIGGSHPQLASGPAGPEGEGGSVETDEGALAVPTGDAAVGHVGPQGQTNLDQLLERFRPLGTLLTRVEEKTEELNNGKQEINNRVRYIAGLVAAKGAPIAVHEAMQEASAIAAELNAAIAEISVQTHFAQELALKALLGLEPVRGGQDRLHAAGASGDVNDRIGS